MPPSAVRLHTDSKFGCHPPYFSWTLAFLFWVSPSTIPCTLTLFFGCHPGHLKSTLTRFYGYHHRNLAYIITPFFGCIPRQFPRTLTLILVPSSTIRLYTVAIFWLLTWTILEPSVTVFRDQTRHFACTHTYYLAATLYNSQGH
jgi:hypothetical protein